MKIIITPTGSFTLLPILTAIDTIFADVIRLRLELYGLMCETLHPDNVISQLHKCRLGKEYKNNLITTMNACMLKNDHASYKMMAQHLLY